METGCQNIQLCSTILKLAFSPAAIGPLFLFPMVYVSFQLLEALALIVMFRCHQRFSHKDEGNRTRLGASITGLLVYVSDVYQMQQPSDH